MGPGRWALAGAGEEALKCSNSVWLQPVLSCDPFPCYPLPETWKAFLSPGSFLFQNVEAEGLGCPLPTAQSRLQYRQMFRVWTSPCHSEKRT